MNTTLHLPDNILLSSFSLENESYISFEKYLEIDVEGAFLEWIDGHVIGFKPNSLLHQQVQSFILTLMSFFVEVNDVGTVIGKFSMKLDEQRRGREPDLVYVARENGEIIKQKYLNGAADIAVEIISPESVERDRKTKFAEYETAKIKEYWLIDPQRRQAEFYHLGEDGFYRVVDLIDGVFHSQVLSGFYLRVEWLWHEQLSTVAALKELNLI